MPCLLVSVMQKAPWTRQNKKGTGSMRPACVENVSFLSGGRERYDDKWVPVADGERLKLSKVEGQVWLTLYQLLLNESCQKKYEFSNSNKATLLKVERAKINNVNTLYTNTFVLSLPPSPSLPFFLSLSL